MPYALPDDLADVLGGGVAVIEQPGPRVWMVEAGGERFVVRLCLDDSPTWVHPMLTSLCGRIAVPEPLRVFADQSFASGATGTWEALSLLPGRAIGFDDRPSMYDVGAFLAAFHLHSIRVSTGIGSRVGGTPLDTLAASVDWQGAPTTMRSAQDVEVLRRLLDGFAADLERHDYASLPACFVHGDPTTFNMLAAGEPPRLSGLIDFELADLEAPVADIAFCLWRSGRPAQTAKHLDVRKVRDLVAGYSALRPLSDREVALVPALLRGRGLQMLVKRTQLRVPDRGPLEEILWIEAHEHELAAALSL